MRDRVTYGEEKDATFLRRACQSRTGSSAIEIVLLGAPEWCVAKLATVGSAAWPSCRGLVAGDCEFGGLVGPLRRRSDGVGDVVSGLVQRIH